MRSNPFEWAVTLLYSYTPDRRVKVTKFKSPRTTKGRRRLYRLIRAGRYYLSPGNMGSAANSH